MVNKTSEKTASGNSPAVAEPPDLSPASRSEDGVYPRRRQVLTGSVAGAGVLLAMQAKTALGASICQSPSAMVSGNQSPRPGNATTCWGGRSSRFWKQPANFGLWTGLTPPKFKHDVNVLDYSGNAAVLPCDLTARGTFISNIFAGAPSGFGVWEVLVWPTNYPTTGNGANCASTGSSDVFGGKGQLLRYLVSAYLNAGAQPSSYPITQAQVIAMWNAVKGGGSYCPTGPASNACAMSANDIIAYISGMDDLGTVDIAEGYQKV